jgi:hypothetical protein
MPYFRRMRISKGKQDKDEEKNVEGSLAIPRRAPKANAVTQHENRKTKKKVVPILLLYSE